MENKLETNIYGNREGQQLMTKIKEKGNLDQPNQQMNLDNIFSKDPLTEIANLLKQREINGHNLKIALLSTLNILSAKLNKSMCLMLASRDPYVGMNILKQCMMMVPKHAYRECGQFKHEELFGGDALLHGKALIGLETSAFTKTWTHLEKMLTMGSTTHVEVIKSKYNTFAYSHRAESLVSVIGVIPDLKDKTYNHPVVLKLPVDVDVDEHQLGHFSVLQDNRPLDVYTEVAIARIRETLARLQPVTVDIPYEDVLLNAINTAAPSDIKRKKEIILKILSICCIINNPSQVNQDEIIARIYNIDINKLRQLKTFPLKNHDTLERPPFLTATKVDYFYTWLLLNDMLPVKELSLSDRQIKIFEAVKRINLGKLSNSFANENIVKQLSQISTSSAYWVKRENIFELLNNSGQEEISQSTIYNELQYLIKEGLVSEGKYPKSAQKGFYIITSEAGKTINLPHPSTIIDNTYKGEKVKVTNPLTGEVETI